MSIIKTLKLKNGDIIACGFHSDLKMSDLAGARNVLVKLQNPIIYSNFRFLDPETNQIVDTVAMAPYNSISDDKEVVIEATQIQSICNMREAAKKRYLQFVNQLDSYNREGDRQLENTQLGQEDHPEIDEESVFIMPADANLH